MADFAELKVVLKSLFEASGLNELDKRVQESVAKIKEGFGGGELSGAMSEMRHGLIDMAAEFVSVKAAAEFLWDSFKEATNAEKLLSGLASTMKVLNGATAEEVEKTKEWLEAASLQYGILDDKLIPAFQTLLTITGDTEQAQGLLQIAMNASRGHIADFGEATNTLARYMQTGVIPRTGELGKLIRRLEADSKAAHGGHVKHAEVLAKLNDEMNRAAQSSATTSDKLDQQKVRWQQTKEAIGSLLLTLVDQLQPVMAAIAIGIAKSIEGWRDLGAVVTMVAQTFGLSMDAMTEFAKGHFAESKRLRDQADAMATDYLEKELAKNAAVTASVAKSWSEQAAKITDSSKASAATIVALGDHMDHLKDKVEKGNKTVMDAWRLRELNVEEHADGEIDRLRQLAALYGEMATDPKLNPLQQAEARVKASKLTEEADKKELAAVKTLRDEKEKAARTEIENIARDEKEKDRLLITHLKIRLQDGIADKDERAKVAKELADLEIKQRQRVEAEEKADAKAEQQRLRQLLGEKKVSLAQELKDEIAYQTSKLKAVKKGSDEEIKILKTIAALKKKMHQVELADAMSAASSMLSLAEGAFGKHKEISIAQALIHTYESAVAAYKAMAAIPYIGPALGIAAAALAVVAGLKNVEEIKKSDPTQGAGFDDPQNDMIAYMGGQRWARDYTEKWGAGAMAGMHAQNQSVTNNNYVSNQPGQIVQNRSVNVGAMPMVDTHREPMMRDLARQLKTYDSLFSDGDL